MKTDTTTHEGRTFADRVEERGGVLLTDIIGALRAISDDRYEADQDRAAARRLMADLDRAK